MRDFALPLDVLMAPLRGFDKLWSVAAVPQGTRDSRHGEITVRAVVGQDPRSNGISCMSCNGSTCPHRAVACAILDVTSAELAAMWRATRVRVDETVHCSCGGGEHTRACVSICLVYVSVCVCGFVCVSI